MGQDADVATLPPLPLSFSPTCPLHHYTVLPCVHLSPCLPLSSDPRSLRLLGSQLVHARARRRFQRGLKSKPMRLIKKLRKAKKEAAANEKPAMVKTHLRDMIIVPEMIGSVVGVYVSATHSIRSVFAPRSAGTDFLRVQSHSLPRRTRADLDD